MTRLLMNSHNIPTAILSTFVPAIFFNPLPSDVRANAPFSFLFRAPSIRASKRYPVTRRSVSCGGDRTFFKIYGTIGKRSVTDVLLDEWRKCPARRFLELVRGIREKMGGGRDEERRRKTRKDEDRQESRLDEDRRGQTKTDKERRGETRRDGKRWGETGRDWETRRETGRDWERRGETGRDAERRGETRRDREETGRDGE